MRNEWKSVFRPGYFGRNRDEKIAAFDRQYGFGNWRLVWEMEGQEPQEFPQACRLYYEEAYFRYLKNRKEDLDFICSFGEVIDNSITNIESGRDYFQQEAFSTHIQDIAIRNVLHRLGLKFLGPSDKILTVRSPDSNGYRFSPGRIPFFNIPAIRTPYLNPHWASQTSVASFWISNKVLQRKIVVKDEPYRLL